MVRKAIIYRHTDRPTYLPTDRPTDGQQQSSMLHLLWKGVIIKIQCCYKAKNVLWISITNDADFKHVVKQTEWKKDSHTNSYDKCGGSGVWALVYSSDSTVQSVTKSSIKAVCGGHGNDTSRGHRKISVNIILQ